MLTLTKRANHSQTKPSYKITNLSQEFPERALRKTTNKTKKKKTEKLCGQITVPNWAGYLESCEFDANIFISEKMLVFVDMNK